MSRKIVVVNAGPRKGWNTDTLLSEAAKGAEAAGAGVERFDLFRLERYTGCIACFGCKREKFKGHCICRDGLTPVLDAGQAAGCGLRPSWRGMQIRSRGLSGLHLTVPVSLSDKEKKTGGALYEEFRFWHDAAAGDFRTDGF